MQNKDINNAFQHIRYINGHAQLHEAGYQKQHQRQSAQKYVFIISVQELDNHDQYDQRSEYGIEQKHPFILTDMLYQLFPADFSLVKSQLR